MADGSSHGILREGKSAKAHERCKGSDPEKRQARYARCLFVLRDKDDEVRFRQEDRTETTRGIDPGIWNPGARLHSEAGFCLQMELHSMVSRLVATFDRPLTSRDLLQSNCDGHVVSHFHTAGG